MVHHEQGSCSRAEDEHHLEEKAQPVIAQHAPKDQSRFTGTAY
jgi:hypothetical protein